MKKIGILLLAISIFINSFLIEYKPVKATGGTGTLNPVTDINKKLQIIATLMMLAGAKGLSYKIEFASKDTINKIAEKGKEVAYDLGNGAYQIGKDVIDLINTQVSNFRLNGTNWTSKQPIEVTVPVGIFQKINITAGQTYNFTSPVQVKLDGTGPWLNIVKIYRSTSPNYAYDMTNNKGSVYSSNAYGGQVEYAYVQPTMQSYTSIPLNDTFNQSHDIYYPGQSTAITNDISLAPNIEYTGGEIGAITNADINTIASVNDYTAPGTDTGTGDTSGFWNKLWEYLEGILTGLLGIPGAIIEGIARLIDIIINVIREAIGAITGVPSATATAIGDWLKSKTTEPPGAPGLPNLLMTLLLIILALIKLLLATITFIIAMRGIPANPSFFPPNVVEGIDFAKSLQIPKFNMSFYNVIVSVVFVLILLRVIKVVRKAINKEFAG